MIRIDFQGPVKQDDCSFVQCELECAIRRKVRLELRDQGTPFMDTKTPYAYPLLGTCWKVVLLLTYLFSLLTRRNNHTEPYKNRGILH